MRALLTVRAMLARTNIFSPKIETCVAFFNFIYNDTCVVNTFGFIKTNLQFTYFIHLTCSETCDVNSRTS